MRSIYSIIFTLCSLFSLAFAEEVACSDVDIIRNTSGEFGLSWKTPSTELLQSWRVEFTLSGSYITTGEIFWSYYSPTSDIRKKGITLSVTDALQFQINHAGNAVTTDVPWLTPGNPYTMAFQFILFENAEGIVQKGEFSVVSADNSISYIVEDVEALEFCAFRKSYENSKVSRFLDLMGSHKYSRMSLYCLSNRIIPEPSTSILLVASLIVLCSRRRR